MSAESYTQCKLIRGDTSQTAWIPTKFARFTATVRIRQGGEWSDGWMVTEVFQVIEVADVQQMRTTVERFRKILEPHR